MAMNRKTAGVRAADLLAAAAAATPDLEKRLSALHPQTVLRIRASAPVRATTMIYAAAKLGVDLRGAVDDPEPADDTTVAGG